MFFQVHNPVYGDQYQPSDSDVSFDTEKRASIYAEIDTEKDVSFSSFELSTQHITITIELQWL